MALGYEVEDDDREFESAKVTRYSTISMSYPCFVVEITDEKPLKQYTLTVLKNMFVGKDLFDEEVLSSMVHLYFCQGDKTVEFGVIKPSQVKTFLKLFESNDIVGYLDSDTELLDDKLYVLAE